MLEQKLFWKHKSAEGKSTQANSSLDSKESDFGLTEEDLLLRSQIKGEVQYIFFKEESVGDRNPTTMAKTGDNKTCSFHKVANGRKAKNFISSLSIDGLMIEDMDKLRRNWLLLISPSIQNNLHG